MQILCEGKVSTAKENNKKTLNQTISTRLSCNIILVKKEHADTLLGTTVMSFIDQNDDPKVVAHDTDILVLLCYHYPQYYINLYFNAGWDDFLKISLIFKRQ